ncbi:hypothetical protein GUITHDRAFT_115934 [Guillardia theta CCMP2712]|uniref:Uncharacterized protein n=1 Tax=Guillardia theta (strain CCMP2712) TaxID=905079 RepID=L1INX2_GUITC|nr:hypothetical protein GUITHDRAFT_115934 [Guillardia theta CCMP2712]EKX37963.1 hypothetical protein GUITHDRAFT_115934 [Guillardia theta CCMP2712]|eukprot:XP_005824943.1 hypothetical protein GUITHDRAFT_115934 [Guillardia theta CCMP2712]
MHVVDAIVCTGPQVILNKVDPPWRRDMDGGCKLRKQDRGTVGIDAALQENETSSKTSRSIYPTFVDRLPDPGLDILPNLKSSQGTNQSSSFSSRVSAATPPHHLDSTGYLPSLEFVNLNETTIARAGDPLALDFKLNGIGPTAISKWKFLSIMLIVNGSDLFWYSTIPKQVAVGYTGEM